MVQLVTIFLSVCCLTGLVCLCVGALGDLLGLRILYLMLLTSLSFTCIYCVALLCLFSNMDFFFVFCHCAKLFWVFIVPCVVLLLRFKDALCIFFPPLLNGFLFCLRCFPCYFCFSSCKLLCFSTLHFFCHSFLFGFLFIYCCHWLWYFPSRLILGRSLWSPFYGYYHCVFLSLPQPLLG